MNQKNKLWLRIFVFFMVFVMAVVPLISTIVGILGESNYDHSEDNDGHSEIEETTTASTVKVTEPSSVDENTQNSNGH